MMYHATLNDLSPTDALKIAATSARNIDDASMDLWRALKPGTRYQPASVEYALATLAILPSLDHIKNWPLSVTLRTLDEIRPHFVRGRARPEPPPEFNGQWPHERLGHKEWKQFVEAPRNGMLKPDRSGFDTPPGLGWSVDYERKLFGGWQKIKKAIGIELPEAPAHEVIEQAAARADALGAEVVRDIGQSKEMGQAVPFKTRVTLALDPDLAAATIIKARDLKWARSLAAAILAVKS